ncbi:MAG: hypothetical protein U5K69_22090 [Balneolaceae bacterium]|nr:hypothetical protein [Balneolaceae bacterium]
MLPVMSAIMEFEEGLYQSPAARLPVMAHHVTDPGFHGVQLTMSPIWIFLILLAKSVSAACLDLGAGDSDVV